MKKLNKYQLKLLSRQQNDFDQYAERLKKLSTLGVTKRYPPDAPQRRKSDAYTQPTTTLQGEDRNASVRFVTRSHDNVYEKVYFANSKNESDIEYQKREDAARLKALERQKRVALVSNKGNYQLPSVIDDPHGFGTKR